MNPEGSTENEPVTRTYGTSTPSTAAGCAPLSEWLAEHPCAKESPSDPRYEDAPKKGVS